MSCGVFVSVKWYSTCSSPSMKLVQHSTRHEHLLFRINSHLSATYLFNFLLEYYDFSFFFEHCNLLNSTLLNWRFLVVIWLLTDQYNAK
jgi:hypothetical protein